MRHHECETKVQEVLALRSGDKRRKHLLSKLRNEGNFLKSVTQEEVVPVRKLPSGTIDIANKASYLPCKYCKGFYKSRALYRHMNKCVHNNENKSKRILAQAEGQSLLSSYRFNDLLRTEIFPRMRADNISFVAKTDPLICAVVLGI